MINILVTVHLAVRMDLVIQSAMNPAKTYVLMLYVNNTTIGSAVQAVTFALIFLGRAALKTAQVVVTKKRNRPAIRMAHANEAAKPTSGDHAVQNVMKVVWVMQQTILYAILQTDSVSSVVREVNMVVHVQTTVRQIVKAIFVNGSVDAV